VRLPPAGSFRAQATLLLAARALVGVFLVLWLAPVSIDDYFRVFHARWWWDHRSFTGSYEWLPGYFYVYGTAVGLTRDMVLAPRALTAALQLGTAIALLRYSESEPSGARLLAVAILLFSPMALVLGTIPLTETLFVCLVVSGVVALRRFLESGDVRAELGAAVLYLAATTIRYEGFAAAALFSAVAISRRPANASRRLGAVVAAVPWIFPVAWSALLWAAKGDPLFYLRNVREDSFGAGDVFGALGSADGMISAALASLAVAVSARRLVAGIRRGRWSTCLLEIHAVAFACGVVAVVATGNVPSQYPARILYPVVAFGALPLAQAVATALAGKVRALVAVGFAAAMIFGVSGLAIERRGSAIPAEDLEAAGAIRAALGSKEIGADEQVVIEHELPSAACLFVFANDAARVHIDALGDTCSPKVLTPLQSYCPMPPWTRRVGLAVVRAGEDEEWYLMGRQWTLVRAVGRWRFYVHPRTSDN
jgi:hypothetical protein